MSRVRIGELSELLNASVSGNPGVAVDRVDYDSRSAQPKSLFVAIRGAQYDGHQFIPQAISQGAAAILSELPPPPGTTIPWLQVTDARLGLALAAARVADYPSRKLRLVGITGTNGKTTTAYLLDSVFRATGEPSAMVGTIVYQIADLEVSGERTTPEAPDIQRLLLRAVNARCRYAVIEVSSHAIDLKRVYGCDFAAAVFTNLTQDHLDYHKTMETYFEVKRRLFEGATGRLPEYGVINRDDPRGLELLQSLSYPCLSYGLSSAADVYPESLDLLGSGLRFTALTPAGPVRIQSELIGRTNAYNLLACVATAVAFGIDRAAIEQGVFSCRAVPGRFEAIREGQDFTVIVDYAHTPDALKNVLQTAHQLGPRRVITVFGCGGDRDPGKRGPMGHVAAELSDYVVLTSDNPRGEDPEEIIRQVAAGIPKAHVAVVKMADRRQAIGLALEEAQAGDLVLIAGKGHESYQVIGTQSVPFDDREVARELLRKKLAANDRYDGPGVNSALSVSLLAI